MCLLFQIEELLSTKANSLIRLFLHKKYKSTNTLKKIDKCMMHKIDFKGILQVAPTQFFISLWIGPAFCWFYFIWQTIPNLRFEKPATVWSERCLAGLRLQRIMSTTWRLNVGSCFKNILHVSRSNSFTILTISMQWYLSLLTCTLPLAALPRCSSWKNCSHYGENVWLFSCIFSIWSIDLAEEKTTLKDNNLS